MTMNIFLCIKLCLKLLLLSKSHNWVGLCSLIGLERLYTILRSPWSIINSCERVIIVNSRRNNKNRLVNPDPNCQTNRLRPLSNQKTSTFWFLIGFFSPILSAYINPNPPQQIFATFPNKPFNFSRPIENFPRKYHIERKK